VLALPVVIIAILFVTAVGTSTVTLILVIGFVFGLLIARTVRTAVLQERDLDYVAAARLRNESNWHIMFVEILPNVLGPILVEFTVRLGYAIFTSRRSRSSASASSPRRRTGAPTSPAAISTWQPGTGGRHSSPRWRSLRSSSP